MTTSQPDQSVSAIALLRDRDAAIADYDHVAFRMRLVLPAAVHRVEVKQMRERRGVAGGIVDLLDAEVG